MTEAKLEIPRLSPSIANTLLSKSPIHAWQQHRLLGNEQKDATAAMLRGRFLEALILNHGHEKLVIIDANDYRTNDAKAQRDAALASGLVPVLREKFAEGQEVADQIVVALKNSGIEFVGKSQVRFEWQSKGPFSSGDGVACSGIMDHLTADGDFATIDDLKIVENAHPSYVQRAMVNYGYHLQDAAYKEAWDASGPNRAGRRKMRFLFCEPKPPYAILIAECAGSMEELGRREWCRAVELWGRCVASNRFPGYTPCRIEATSWQMSAAEQAEENQPLEAA